GYTLEYFQSHTTLKKEKFYPLHLWIEPPLCAQALGINAQYIDTDHNLQPEICFLHDEVHDFEKKTSTPNKQTAVQNIGADDQPLERIAIKSIYTKLSNHAWEKNFNREKDNDLINAKTKHTRPFQYSKKDVEKWLIM